MSRKFEEFEEARRWIEELKGRVCTGRYAMLTDRGRVAQRSPDGWVLHLDALLIVGFSTLRENSWGFCGRVALVAHTANVGEAPAGRRTPKRRQLSKRKLTGSKTDESIQTKLG